MGLTISDLPAGTPPYDPQTLVEFSVPDGSGGYVSRKANLSDVAGVNLLARVSVDTPVSYIDITLPAGFSLFKLDYIGVGMSANDFLSIAFSYDGGTTFLCDTTNFDSYVEARSQFNNFPDTPSTGWNTGAGVDSLMTVSANVHKLPADPGYLPIGLNGSMTIDPGSATTYPSLLNPHMGAINSPSGGLFYQINIGSVNLNATVPTAVGRANMVRMLPYGNGDCNPPTSGETIVAGTLTVWGVPT